MLSLSPLEAGGRRSWMHAHLIDHADGATAGAQARSRASLSIRGWGCAVSLLMALSIGGAGIFNEGYVSLQGDMPRFLMNGVFLRDMLMDRPFGSLTELVDYAHLYYARYPALSLGHHPPLIAVAQIPMYTLFGISIAAGKLVSLIAFAASAGLLYLTVTELYGALAGLAAAAFFATSPMMKTLTQGVLSEGPAVALVLAAAYCLQRFCASGRRRALVGFVITATLSLYAKQLAIFVFPAFLVVAAMALGVRRLLRRDVLLAALAIVVMALPLVPLTLALSPVNVGAALAFGGPLVMTGGPARVAIKAIGPQLIAPVAWIALGGVGLALVRRDRRAIPLLAVIGSVFIGVWLVGRYEPERYSIWWLPALCALAASVATGWRRPGVSAAIVVALFSAAAVQAHAARDRTLPGADGYEAAARFVVESNPGPTVLFSGDIDTGFFTFFVRKHDADRRLVVLRADKVLTTSMLANVDVEHRIERPEQIYDVLHTYGTRYVVIEERPSMSAVHGWLHREARSARFAERTRIPIVTADPRLHGTSLVVYELLDAGPPDATAVLQLNLPIVGQSVSVRLSDLMNRKSLR